MSKVTIEKHGQVLHIGINRPEKRNACDLEVLEGLAAGYERLSTDEDIRAGLVFGHGEHFTAGLDLADVDPAVRAGGPRAMFGGATYDPFGFWGKPASKPVVMAVQGTAFTIAIELCLASDIVVVSEDVRFNQLEVARGFPPFGGATFRAPQQLGWGNAMRFLLTAEDFGAEEARRIGLAQEVVPPGEQLTRADELAQRIAAQAPLAVQAVLRNARVGRDGGEAAAVSELEEDLPGILDSDDAAEGLQSFLERRVARFQGR